MQMQIILQKLPWLEDRLNKKSSIHIFFRNLQ